MRYNLFNFAVLEIFLAETKILEQILTISGMLHLQFFR